MTPTQRICRNITSALMLGVVITILGMCWWG